MKDLTCMTVCVKFLSVERYSSLSEIGLEDGGFCESFN